jgi:hypothetical protein
MGHTGKLFCYIDTKTESTSSSGGLTPYSLAKYPSEDRCFSTGALTPSTLTEYFGITSEGAFVGSALTLSDAVVFLGAQAFVADAHATMTRLAAGNWAWVMAASNTSNFSVNLTTDVVPRTTAGKGLQLNSFDVIYLPIGATLTSITPHLYQATFVNNTVVSVASSGSGIAITAGTNTLTVPSTGPYVFNQAVTTPAFFNPSGDVSYTLEVQFVNPTSSVPNFYGVQLYFTEVPL